MAVVFFIVNAFLTVITSIVLACNKILACDCNSSKCFQIRSTLLLLFGIVYLVYHGFWLIIALMAYPGRILIGSMFIVPAISVIVPTWTILIKVIKCCCSCEDDDDEIIPIWKGFGWICILILDVTIWGLFIGILYYISKFLLSSVDLETKTFQSIFSFVTVSGISIMLIWLNTDLISNQRNDQGNQQTERNQEELIQN